VQSGCCVYGSGEVFVQTCIKGVNGISSTEAKKILEGGGIQCNWWRRVHGISPDEINERLTSANLDLHVNSYGASHPVLPGQVKEETPFISLTAGSVERSVFLKTNFVHPAHRTALWFASDFGRLRGECFLFYCWVVVALTPAVEIRHLAEEVRELNTYRRYSAFQTEGEIVAKIDVSARQIHRYEQYRISGGPGNTASFSLVDTIINSLYVDPYSIVNIREAF
jgi:hypothetical protein